MLLDQEGESQEVKRPFADDLLIVTVAADLLSAGRVAGFPGRLWASGMHRGELLQLARELGVLLAEGSR